MSLKASKKRLRSLAHTPSRKAGTSFSDTHTHTHTFPGAGCRLACRMLSAVQVQPLEANLLRPTAWPAAAPSPRRLSHEPQLLVLEYDPPLSPSHPSHPPNTTATTPLAHPSTHHLTHLSHPCAHPHPLSPISASSVPHQLFQSGHRRQRNFGGVRHAG